MYKCTDNTQSNFLSFNQPIGLHMNPENRWIRMADAIPWEIFEKKIILSFVDTSVHICFYLRSPYRAALLPSCFVSLRKLLMGEAGLFLALPQKTTSSSQVKKIKARGSFSIFEYRVISAILR